MMGLPAQLVMWDSKQQLSDICIITSGQQCRSLAFFMGRLGAQSAWLMCPSLSMLLSSRGERSDGRVQCSVWKRSSTNANASGEAQTKRLWKEYFANPSQWWDNRANKRNPKSSDFIHKVTRQALWIDDWSTPSWVNAMLKPVSEDKLQLCVGGFHRKEFRRSDDAISEAIAILKNHLEQGIIVDSNMYVDILQQCSKHRDLVLAKQVHDCITKSGMEQNIYVANNLMTMYIRCGRLQVACEVFDKLVKKSVVSWTIMIGGYAEHNCVEDAKKVFNQMLQEGAQPNKITYLNILKACTSPLALEWGKEVHAHIRHGGFELDVRVGTALIKMYAKSGNINDAQVVFDKMKDRDVITWTVMIGGLAKHGFGHEAYELFLQMHKRGFVADDFTYVNILNTCSSVGALQWVKEVHNHAFKAGLDSRLRVGNALIHMYAKSGSIEDAQLVFDRMKDRDVITWNVMIGGLAKHGFGHEAYDLFLQMHKRGFVADEFTYVNILNACSSKGALEWVKEVHNHALKVGLDVVLRVGNAFIHMYAKSGSIEDAQSVFDRMKDRDVITWNVMIGGLVENGFGHKAYELFLQMHKGGFVADEFTYMSILNACASKGALEWVKEVHNHALEARLDSGLRVGTALIHMYAKSGSIDDARLVFQKMVEHNVITWTAMIGGLAEHGCGHEAYELFVQMHKGGFVADEFTYVSILNACASAGALEWVKEVHNHALEAGLDSNLRVGNALIHMYAKSGSIDDARLVFQKMVERNVITWNVMIGGLAEHGCGHEAYDLFVQMHKGGFVADELTYVSILDACASMGALEWVKEVHNYALKAGLDSSLRVGSALVHMYAKSGSIEDARLIFDKIKDRDVITWNVMIGGLAEHGFGHEAYELFLQMHKGGFVANDFTYVNILNACSSTGALEWVKEVHNHALKAGLDTGLRVGNALVHMYAKSGSIEDAKIVFNRMKDRDVITWNVMIGGLAQHGCGHEALQLFGMMNAKGVEPSGCTFIAVLSACSHAGLVNEGRHQFLAMAQNYGMEPTIEHYNCMVDLLGRAGHLEEAHVFIQDMSLEPDATTWGALLGACRTHANVELAELAFKESLKLDPMDASIYVLLSNIYAIVGKWDQVSLVRTMMQERGIRKEPGRSWIKIDEKIHSFVVGDTSHPEAKEIYVELKRLTRILKTEGYVPDTQLVLRNIDDKDKELALCSHSEKLAIAYGLLRIPHGKPIRIYKNLRVCSDCHTATKCISKVAQREIVARDANRFHHFKDGVCSCGDYW